MNLKFLWFLPTYGDSRYIVGGGHGLPAGVAGGNRPATLGYLGQIARSAEQLGYIGALTPTGAWCEDAFIVDSMLASVTETFQFLVDCFSADRTCIAIDMRGFGRTQRPDDGYWFPDYLADVDALLDQLAPDAPVDLIGHSMGGNIAMLYAGARPNRVRRTTSRRAA